MIENQSGIYFLPEDVIKREIRIINRERLADTAYVNNRPIYLQDSGHYSWDKTGERPVNDYRAVDTTHFFKISLSPSAEWRLE